MRPTGLSIASVSRVDDDEVVSTSGIAQAKSDRSVGEQDASRELTKSKNKTKSGHLGNSNNIEKPKFSIFGARKAFNHLKQTFIEALIFHHFDLECHIRIEINASNYAIKGHFSQLILNQLAVDETIKSNIDWHLIAYFSKKNDICCDLIQDSWQ